MTFGVSDVMLARKANDLSMMKILNWMGKILPFMCNVMATITMIYGFYELLVLQNSLEMLKFCCWDVVFALEVFLYVQLNTEENDTRAGAIKIWARTCCVGALVTVVFYIAIQVYEMWGVILL